MGLADSVIETGVDKLVKLVNSRGRIASEDAAVALGVSATVVMEWSDFLEEEGIISIEYKFTKPFLVVRKMEKKEVQEKAKEFSGKKDIFVRKAEGSLSFLSRESKKLQSLKDEFDKIKKELGLDIGSIRKELDELERYEQLKVTLDKQIDQQKVSSIDTLRDLANKILREREKYRNILEGIKKEQEVLKKDKVTAKSIEESEKIIEEKVASLIALIKKVSNKAKKEEENIKISESNIQKLTQMAQTARDRVEKEKALIDPLVQNSKEQAEKISELQNLIVKKISSKEKKLKGVKKASVKMKSFFKKKMGVLDFIDTVNKDRNALKKELIELIKKAKSFELSSKSADIGKEMADIEKKFTDVDKKKNIFESELKKLGTFFK